MREVSIPLPDGGAMRANLCLSDRGHAPFAGVVVIHEILGLTGEIRRICRDFAAAGYAALAPDLFDKPEPRAVCVARAVLSVTRGHGPEFAELEAARAFLAAQPEVDGARLGVAGFCMGGGFATLLAARGGYRAAAPFYGNAPRDAEALRGACPIVASFGGRDAFLATAPARLERHLEALGVPHDVKVYPDAGHSFMTHAERGFVTETVGGTWPLFARYHEPSARDAWRRVLLFFGTHLGAAQERTQA